MKNPVYLLIVLLSIFFISCTIDDAVPPVESLAITNISLNKSSSVQEAQEIEVTVHKGTPCQYVSKTEKTISGNIYNYNFIVDGQEKPCITVVAEEVVTVIFDPVNTGIYSLNFLINGELFQTETVTVLN